MLSLGKLDTLDSAALLNILRLSFCSNEEISYCYLVIMAKSWWLKSSWLTAVLSNGTLFSKHPVQ